VATAFNPILPPPPIPLIPPTLFSPHPSLPDLRNPSFSDWYWGRNNNGVKGDYIRDGGRGAAGDFLRGSGMAGLGSIGLGGDDRMKKSLYRSDLLK
jgi:hypothetical protein